METDPFDIFEQYGSSPTTIIEIGGPRNFREHFVLDSIHDMAALELGEACPWNGQIGGFEPCKGCKERNGR